MAKKKVNKQGIYGGFFVLFMLVMAAALIIVVNMFQAKDTGLVTEERSTIPQTTVANAGAIGVNELRLTSQNFTKEVIKRKGVVLVDFYLATCPYCQQVAADVTATAAYFDGKAKVGKIEASENPELSEKYGIKSVPTFIIFKDGKVKETVAGVKSKAQLIEMVEKYL